MTASLVTVSIEVAASPQIAFQVFTTLIDTWWLRGPKHRFRPPWSGKLVFEPRVGGRLLEEYVDGTSFVIGRVSHWSAGERLVLSWHLPNFNAGETTEVEVRFAAIDGGTRVSVEHRGWDRLRPDHPARHGKAGRDYEYMKARLWADNLTALRAFIEVQTTCQQSAGAYRNEP